MGDRWPVPDAWIRTRRRSTTRGVDLPDGDYIVLSPAGSARRALSPAHRVIGTLNLTLESIEGTNTGLAKFLSKFLNAYGLQEITQYLAHRPAPNLEPVLELLEEETPEVRHSIAEMWDAVMTATQELSRLLEEADAQMGDYLLLPMRSKMSELENFVHVYQSALQSATDGQKTYGVCFVTPEPVTDGE